MLSFNNTEIAFSDKSDYELNRAYMLFSFMKNPILPKISKPLLNFALWIHLPIKGIIRASVFKHFCGGENLKETAETIARLAKYNVKGIPDYSVEGKESEEDFNRVTNEIISIINFIKGNPNTPFAVFKPTGLARFALLEKVNAKKKLSNEEETEYKKVVERFDKVGEAAYNAGIYLMIDAEETWIQDAVDGLVEGMMRKYNHKKPVVFNTLQMYRHDRLEYLKKSIAAMNKENIFSGYKLVRGAYIEQERERAEKMGYPSPIHKTKADTDRDFNLAVEYCLEHFPKVALFSGTHNEESCSHLAEKITEKKLDKTDSRIYFSQLFGMGDNLSFNLASEGYNVAKYIPYGPVKDVMPYLLRRAEENTSVAGQTGRELKLITTEIKRRKGKR